MEITTASLSSDDVFQSHTLSPCCTTTKRKPSATAHSHLGQHEYERFFHLIRHSDRNFTCVEAVREYLRGHDASCARLESTPIRELAKELLR